MQDPEEATSFFEQIKQESVDRINRTMDYAEACGTLACEMGLDYDDCPYNEHNVHYDIWRLAFRVAVNNGSRPTPTEADSPMAPVCGRCGQRKCTCQHGPYPSQVWFG